MTASASKQKKLVPDRLATAETSVSDSTASVTASSEHIPHYNYSKSTHYYASNRRFEQSVDVYQPSQEQSRGVIALVVGSGWLGHQPWVYWGTSWWNSSLPIQISSLGYTCVVIRHSGGFPRISGCSWTTVMTMLLIVHLVVYGILKYLEIPQGNDENDSSTDVVHNQMVLATFVACFWFIFWYWQGQGSATLKDMLHDVSAALNYVDKHIMEWHGTKESDDDDDDKKDDKKLPIVFGGYSSGAHVAATLLSTPTLTPLPSKYTSTTLRNMDIQHILYVSGFLGVSPSDFVTAFLTQVVLGQWPSNVPSPLVDLKNRGGIKTRSKSLPLPPHTLVGCQHEVFGLPILKSAFCSDEYARVMNEQEEGSAEWIPLKEWTCNHWSVLSTIALRKALHESLGRVFGDNISDEQ